MPELWIPTDPVSCPAWWNMHKITQVCFSACVCVRERDPHKRGVSYCVCVTTDQALPLTHTVKRCGFKIMRWSLERLGVRFMHVRVCLTFLCPVCDFMCFLTGVINLPERTFILVHEEYCMEEWINTGGSGSLTFAENHALVPSELISLLPLIFCLLGRMNIPAEGPNEVRLQAYRLCVWKMNFG